MILLHVELISNSLGGSTTMHQKRLLTYAFDSSGNFVHIDKVAKGLACDCYCPSCKEKLVAKNGGMKRIHHFAHASGVDCERGYETMLHQLAKLRVQEAFLSKEVFYIDFEYRSYCPHVKTCTFVRYGNCYISTHKRFNLKKIYDSCEQEVQYDSINRRSDLKIFSSKNPQLTPIYIEFFVTHASDVSKLHNGGKIIEVKIESENDIQRIVDNGFIESGKHDRGTLEAIGSENINETTFWGFRSEDYNAININQEVEFSRYILYASGKSVCYQDRSLCKNIAKARKQSLLEICIHKHVTFGVYEMLKYQGYKRFGIKSLYCKNYVDSYDGSGKLCRLYKYLGLKRFEQHDTARAKDCPRFLVNQDEMNEELKHFESLNEGEYTELSGKTG